MSPLLCGFPRGINFPLSRGPSLREGPTILRVMGLQRYKPNFRPPLVVSRPNKLSTSPTPRLFISRTPPCCLPKNVEPLFYPLEVVPLPAGLRPTQIVTLLVPFPPVNFLPPVSPPREDFPVLRHQVPRSFKDGDQSPRAKPGIPVVLNSNYALPGFP